MRSKKFWLVLSIILVAIGLATFMVIVRKPVDNRPSSPPSNQGLEIETDEIDGVTLIIPGAGKGDYWELKVVKCSCDSNIGHLENIKGEFFKAKKVRYRISAETGNINKTTNILILRGDVKFVAGDKELDADELLWNPGAGMRVITARTHVIFKTPDLTVNATQVSMDPDFTKINFSGAMKASFNHDSAGH